MPNSYEILFNKAFDNYQQQTKRPGHGNGFFSWFRHSKKLYPHIAQLQKDLSEANDFQAQNILERYFKSPATTMNNHSFGIYLLDQLMSADPERNWSRFIPTNKQIVFFTGTLYRGTLQEPNNAFENSISEPQRSENIEDYTSHTSMSVGVSTSTSRDIASSYKNHASGSIHAGMYVQYGYLYKIKYRGIGGVDINQTLKARGVDIENSWVKDKKEVNIIGKIPPEDIKGYWDKHDRYWENPRYVKGKNPEIPVSLVSRLFTLFSRNDAQFKTESIHKEKAPSLAIQFNG